MSEATTLRTHAKAWLAKIRALKATLDERERAIMRWRLTRHPPERTQRALGAAFELSGARINQLERRLWRKIEAATAHEARAVAVALGANTRGRRAHAQALEQALPRFGAGARTLLATQTQRARASAALERESRRPSAAPAKRTTRAKTAIDPRCERTAEALRTGVIASAHHETHALGEHGAHAVARNLMQWWYAPRTGWRERTLVPDWCRAMAERAPQGGNAERRLAEWVDALARDPARALAAHARVEALMHADGGWGWATAYTAFAHPPEHASTGARALAYLAGAACALGRDARSRGMAGVAARLAGDAGALDARHWRATLARAKVQTSAGAGATLATGWLDGLIEGLARAEADGVLAHALARAWDARARTGASAQAEARRHTRRAQASVEIAERIARAGGRTPSSRREVEAVLRPLEHAIARARDTLESALATHAGNEAGRDNPAPRSGPRRRAGRLEQALDACLARVGGARGGARAWCAQAQARHHRGEEDVRSALARLAARAERAGAGRGALARLGRAVDGRAIETLEEMAIVAGAGSRHRTQCRTETSRTGAHRHGRARERAETPRGLHGRAARAGAGAAGGRSMSEADEALERAHEQWSPFGLGDAIMRHSEVMQIGRHEWRLTLYRHPRYGVLVGYEWRTPTLSYAPHLGPGRWRRDEEWPRYDANDGQYAGLPRTLKKLWQRCPWAHRDHPERQAAEGRA